MKSDAILQEWESNMKQLQEITPKGRMLLSLKEFLCES